MNKPIWEPGTERIERANMSRFMRFVRENTGNEDIRRYAPLYDFSVRHPEKFWPLVWEFCGIRASGDFDAGARRWRQDARRALVPGRAPQLRAEPAAPQGRSHARSCSATNGAIGAS